MQLIVIEYAGEPIDTGRHEAVVFHPPGGTIGRASDNHLVLLDDTRQISRLQALLQVGDDACLLKNLSSVSAIEVNREPIGYAEERPLNTGDIIRIGPYVLRAESGDTAAPGTVDGGVAAPHAPAASHDDAGASRHRLWGLLQHRFPPVRTRAGPPVDPPARDELRPPPRDLHQLSTDPLDLFAQLSGDVASPASKEHDVAAPTPARAAASRASSFTQADHAPGWTQHVRVELTQPTADADADPPAEHPPGPPTPEALLRAFLEGTGLDGAADPHQWSAEQMYVAGRLLAMFANGTVELLSSRSILKREVKSHMTMLLDRENNPLKMLPDGSAVLRQMFGLPLPGFMSPQSAVDDAFQDLHAHQLGIVAGMRAALMDLLRRFSPRRMGDRDEASRWYERRVPMLYKARMWDSYVAAHRDTVLAVEDDFASVFGKAFLAAYDAEIERYRSGNRR
ncbi:FHA domain-containing protein [Caballeronia calidae]|uniref:FHA domain-containing protein n=1 Tax=Caballeronia calidae TaxID=1777139 RepID=A0A158CKU0_9BURK|nr:type VI secretion system-associated FHA domain protein TagH [Caballeronia calidae]SAK82993.1 FHA domain-containing protein [Caballeronia calidae]